MSRIRLGIAVLLVMMLLPAVALASGPRTAPEVMFSEGFESAESPLAPSGDARYAIEPITAFPSDGNAYWGRIGNRKNSGQFGLWCAGTNPALFPTYSAWSAGTARFTLSETENMYSSSLRFFYTMPSRGDGDATSFSMIWRPDGVGAGALHASHPLTAVGQWNKREYELSAGAYSLARTPGSVTFTWADHVEGAGATKFQGEGPTIDDVSLSGWTYGPVRSLAAVDGAGGAQITWQKPYRAQGSTDVEERTVTYDIWRRLKGRTTWTLVQSRFASGATNVTFTDAAVSRADDFTYAVQARGAAADSGYGAPVVINNATPLAPILQVAGDNRIATAIQGSKLAYPSGLNPAGAKTVIIATGLNWPDALGGASLAGVIDGPVLLVDGRTLSQPVIDEIRRLKAEKAYILGGEAAVSAAVRDALVAELKGTSNVERIPGSNRYETAKLIAQKVIALQGAGYDGGAFVATGGNFPDALAAAPLAASAKWPLFLSDPSKGISDSTKVAMGAVKEAVILGGEGAVSTNVEAGLVGDLGRDQVVRLKGADRYATAVEVAAFGVREMGLYWNRAGVATGQNFPDALAGGVVQGKVRSIMLLTRSATLEPAVEQALKDSRAHIDTVTYYGGASAVSPAVRDAVTQALK